VFDLYPRHGHRTPDQIAEDTGGSFEPARLRRRASDFDENGRPPRTESTSRPEDSTTQRKSDNPTAQR
jgi:hypothetical protein